MATQRETVLIAEPFSNHLTGLGWNVNNTHGNQYQKGYPDKYITHSNHMPKWVEYKVIEEDGYVKWTDAQRKIFPLWLANNVPIYVIAAYDLRGKENFRERKRLYTKLFESPNAIYLFNKMTHRLMY